MFFKSKKIKQASLSDALPVFSYENGKVIFKDGRVAIIYRLTSAEMERWDEDTYAGVNVAFQQALRSAPVGAVFQKTDVYYDRPYVHPPTPEQYFSNRMGDYFGNRLVLYHESYIALSFAPAPPKSGSASATNQKPPRPVSALNALINKADQALPPSVFATVASTLALADHHASEFVESLRGIPDISLERMDEMQVRNLYLRFMNLDFDGQPDQYEREMTNEIGTLGIGEQKVSCVSMVGQGTELFPCVTNSYGVVSPFVYPLTHFLTVPHVFTQSIQVVDTAEGLKALDRDRLMNSSLSAFANQDNHIRVAEIDLFTAECRVSEKQLCLLHASILLWETNDGMRKANVEAAKAALKCINGTKAAVESLLTLPLFFASLPGNGFQVPDRWIPTTTDRAACYVHWTTTYRGTDQGEYICDRNRNLTRINLFNMQQDNQNSLTIGPSGSGKSFAMGNFIVQRFEQGSRQIIIDVGLGPGQGSYRNVVQALNGADFENTYFEYDPVKPIEFNPFYVPREAKTHRWLYEEEKKTFHLSLLATLWKGGHISKSETAILAKYLGDYYKHLNRQENIGQHDEIFPGLENFYRFVKAHHDLMENISLSPGDGLAEDRAQYAKDQKYFQMDEFLLVLREYISGGRYEKVLNARRDVDLSSYKLICFDMARVKADPTLYPVVAMLITELALDQFRRFPKDKKYILMDEAWSMLSGALESFIENMYRTCRKSKGSIGIITQGIEEIVKSPIGSVLIRNSDTKIILRHEKEEALLSLQVPLALGTHEMSLIKSVRSGDTYREFVIMQGKQAKVYCLEASPELNAILSSRPDDREYLNSLVTHYQYTKPVLVLDKQGNAVRDAFGQPTYTTVTEQRLSVAVDEYVATRSKA